MAALDLTARWRLRKAVLDGVYLAAPPGAVLGICGPPGCGKTSVLLILAGLSRPSSGVVRVLGLDPWRQHRWLSPHLRFIVPVAEAERLSVAEHLSCLVSGWAPSRSQRRTAVSAALTQVGLADKAAVESASLSKASLHKLALATALVGEPRVLLVDGIVDGLEPASRAEVGSILGRAGGQAIKVITGRDSADLVPLCHQVVSMEDGRTVGWRQGLLRDDFSR